MKDWLTMLTDATQMFLFLALELSVLFLVISAGVSLIRQKIPDSKIQAMLGARKGRGYLISAVLGESDDVVCLDCSGSFRTGEYVVGHAGV